MLNKQFSINRIGGGNFEKSELLIIKNYVKPKNNASNYKTESLKK